MFKRNDEIPTYDKLGHERLFKISRFKEKIKKTSPHKHDNYYELIFLCEGEGFHCIESEKYMISTPEFYFLKPGQLHFWQFTSIPKGFVLLFKDSEFDRIKENDLINLYQQFWEAPRIAVPNKVWTGQIINEIYNEFKLNKKYSKEIIHGLLKALLGKLLQVAGDNPNKSGLPQSIYKKFQMLLVKECPKLHKVNEFADLLHITPQNLNAICRKQADKNASEIITSQVLLEAKRYILHTDYTINEIADILSFSDSSNFIKFFKKFEGLTPTQFRKKYFQ